MKITYDNDTEKYIVEHNGKIGSLSVDVEGQEFSQQEISYALTRYLRSVISRTFEEEE